MPTYEPCVWFVLQIKVLQTLFINAHEPHSTPPSGIILSNRGAKQKSHPEEQFAAERFRPPGLSSRLRRAFPEPGHDEL